MSTSRPSNAKRPHPAGAFPPLREVLAGRRILLTGATGFLGKTFLYLLLRWYPEIARIYLLIRGDRTSSRKRFEREVLDSEVFAPLREELGEEFSRRVARIIAPLPGDITQSGLLRASAEIPPDESLDAVVNCAGLVNFEAPLGKALAINALGVSNVVDFCRARGASLLHVSTCYVAGEAAGPRHEDEIPENWCPKNGADGGFELRREIREALAAVERLEAASHDPAREEPDHGDSESEEAEQEAPRQRREHDRKRWLEEQQRIEGRRRAQRWGWPNTYSYSKSLGEQIALSARHEIRVTVVRPAVIESALRDPFPGWNQGVNTSAPLTYLASEGYRFYPARPELVLDVIPVDLVAHAMVPILAALMLGRHRPIYQLGTSDTNPLPMRRLVELTALANRREHRRRGGLRGRLAPHLEAVVTSPRTYDLVSRGAPSALSGALRLAELTLGKTSPELKRFRRWVEEVVERIELARKLIEIYRPYIHDLSHTFHCRNIRELYQLLDEADVSRHPFAPEALDWQDYWVNVHVPGLRRHVFPKLDLHTRPRNRAPIRRFGTLLELLETSAERYGDLPALVARAPGRETRTLSYRELHELSQRASLMLQSRGVEPGARILLIGEGSPDWVLGFFAIIGAGAIAVPLDHHLGAEDLRRICEIAEPTAALCSAAVRERLGRLNEITRREIVELEFEDLRRPFVLPTHATRPEVTRDTVASIVFTSGTTGNPKGVVLTHGNFAAQVASLSRVFFLDETDVVLSLLPLHHTFEFTCGMLLPIASGAQVVYPVGIDTARLAHTLAEVKPTALIGVPALWQAVHRRILERVESRGALASAAFDELRSVVRRITDEYQINPGKILFRPFHAALGGRLQLAVSGGAALPRATAEFFRDIGIPLLEGYGLTEAAPVLSVARPDEPNCIGSVGRPIPGVTLRLDASSPGETAGEILAKGPNIMAGYYRNPEATAKVLSDGWLRTGDLGRFDEEGRLFIVGRIKDVIVDSGGNNIYIDELEDLYGRSQYLKELAIVGLRIGAGEQAAALAVPAYEAGASRRQVEDQLRRHFERVSAELAPHQRLRIIRFVDHPLPRTRTRKIKRNEVAEILHRLVSAEGAPESAASSEVEPWLMDALNQVAGTDLPAHGGSRLIEDLGLDSLALAELAEILADRTGRLLLPEQLTSVSTVAELQELLGRTSARPYYAPSYSHLAEPYVPRLPKPVRELGNRWLRRGLEAALQSFFKPRIIGRGNIPANRNFLAVANHASHLDFALVRYALGSVGENLAILAARDYFFDTRLKRMVLQNLTPLVPFDRHRAQLESLDQALELLREGRTVLMFPEGTRSPDGAVHEFKSGAGYLALLSGVDVLPIRLLDTHAAFGRGRLFPKRVPVEVRIGAPISSEALARAAGLVEGPAEIHIGAQDATGAAVRGSQKTAGAYRRAAELMRAAVLALGTPAASKSRAARTSDAALPAPATRRSLRNARNSEHQMR